MENNAQDVGDKTPSNVLSRRLNKILETRLENDKDTLEALKELSTFFPENTLTARRNLRSKIEKRSLLINEDFLSAFKVVKEAMDEIYNDVTAMNTSVQSMTNRLQLTKNQTQNLIDQTTKLRGENQKLTTQNRVANAFLDTFQLSASELETLRGANRDSPITPDFFVVLERVQTIHTKCRILMQSGHQAAALDVMEQMALLQETALERLYRWTQSRCRDIEAADAIPLLAQAMARLQERPLLFKYVLDEYCASRRSILARAFIDAITVGGPGGTPRPMEHFAHEPRRYLGDMLAWLHQAVPSEGDSLRALLASCRTNEAAETAATALAQLTDAVCHPLRVRAEHALAAENDPAALYALAHLLRFYKGVVGGAAPGGSLQTLLTELEEVAEGRFFAVLRDRVTLALSGPESAPPADLSPGVRVTALLGLLREVLAVQGVAEGRQRDLPRVVAAVVDPLLRSASEVAARLPCADMAVYLLNCLHATQGALALYEFVDERLERLSAQADAQLDTLSAEQAGWLVANLDLGALYAVLQAPGAVANLDGAGLRGFLDKLEAFLALPEALLLPQVALLASGAHRATVQRRGFEVIAAVYAQLHAAVHAVDSGYPQPAQLLPRSPEEVARMLR